MGTRVHAIQLMVEKGQPGVCVLSANGVAGHGLQGDRHCMKDRPISITDRKMQQWIAQQEYDGLCFHKYKANILLDDLDGVSFQTGDVLQVGPCATVQIDSALKECYLDECELYRQGIDCIMPGRMVFACCLRGGRMAVGDQVSNLPS